MPENRAANTVNCNMVPGDVSAGVKQLQVTLNLCHGEHLSTDSVYGTLTEDALKRAQRAAGTTADGIYGPNTRKAITHQAMNGGCIRVP